LNSVLREIRPTALAWDLTAASPGDWTIIQQLRGHPQLCQLPFILYSQEDGETARLSVGITDVMMKPVSRNSLMEAINALRPPDRTGCILIVNDDPQARALHQRLAAEALPGYPIRLAENGQAALAILAEETPSLLILDLIMPDVDGFAVLEQMRAQPTTRLVPVLVTSGKLLSWEDVRRLDYAAVTFQSKNILSVDEVLASLQRSFSGQPVLPQPTSTLVKRVLAYLHQNYTRAFSRQEIATAIGVSKNYLSEIFRQEMGLSPWECLNRLRIQRAKELLRDTGETITAIAAQVGFEDSAYFSRVFHKWVGQSPQAYRQSR
jgi:YesN/AraC family two-component response regulator